MNSLVIKLWSGNGLGRRRSNSLWVYIISLRTQVHSQIKIHSQIDRCRPYRRWSRTQL